MAKYKLLLPKMGESVAEATVIKWTKNPGDHIEADETVMEIATDKVDSDVPSPVEGKLLEQLCKDNDVVQVGAVIAIIETDEPEEPTLQTHATEVHLPVTEVPPPVVPPIPVVPPVAEVPPAPVTEQHIPEQHTYQAPEVPPVQATYEAPEAPSVQTTYEAPTAPAVETAYHTPEIPPVPQPEIQSPEVPNEPVFTEQRRDFAEAVPFVDQLSSSAESKTEDASRNGNGLRFYSPLVKNIASQEGLSAAELDQIPGTGAEGRLTKDDLLNYLQNRYQKATTPPPVTEPAAPEPIETAPVEGSEPEAETAAVPVDETAETVSPEAVAETYEHHLDTAAAEPVAETPAAEPVAETAEEPVTPANEPVAETIEAPETAAEAETPAGSIAETSVAATVEAPAPESGSVVETAPVVTPEPEVAASQPEPVVETPKPEPATTKPAPAVSVSGGDEIIEMDRMRRLIADHMVMSKHTSPHVTSFVEADVTNLVLWRDKIKATFEKREGQKITFTPIFIEAVARAIKDLPMINVQVNGTQIIKKKDINIGMATALPSGNLIVPVIKRADELNLIGLTKAVNDLAGRARTGKLKPDDAQGGTFTITNVGSFGNAMGTPIINQPQVAILAVGAIKKKPAVIETLEGDMIGIRHMMFLSLSYDHRVVDGALGGSFVRRVADYLENWDTGREI